MDQDIRTLQAQLVLQVNNRLPVKDQVIIHGMKELQNCHE